MDTLVTEGGKAVVRHYLIDFSSTMGSASIKAREYDEGFEYIVDGKATLKNMAGLGFYIPRTTSSTIQSTRRPAISPPISSIRRTGSLVFRTRRSDARARTTRSGPLGG